MIDLLRRFLTLGVGEGEGEEDPPKVDDADPPEDDDPAALLDAEDDDPPAKVEPKQQARNRERELEDDLARERARNRDLESRAAPPRSASDPDTEREEKKIADAKAAGWNADQLYWLEQQIATDRRARSAERNSQSALLEARNLSDKAKFDRLETTKPGLYKRYATRVEEEVAKLHASGQHVSRNEIIAYLVGKDAMNGDVKTKTKAAPADTGGKKVDRGRTPGARSDVNTKNQRTGERDARRERLRNTFI